MDTSILLGQRLNTIHNKIRLQQVFSKMDSRFPNIFKDIPVLWKEKCLTALAQKCTHNKRRRLSCHNAPVISRNTETPVVSDRPFELAPEPARTLSRVHYDNFPRTFGTIGAF